MGFKSRPRPAAAQKHLTPAIPTEYRLYDPNDAADIDDELLYKLTWIQHDEPFTIRGFTSFSTVVELGYEQVSYNAALLESGHLYWITDRHAEMIGRALTSNLRYWGLLLTCCEGDGFRIMARNVADRVTIEEVLIKHITADDVTATEAAGIARLITRLQTRRFHLWAGVYEPGALDAFCDTLLALDNRSLRTLDVCDVSVPEPDDEIRLPRLDDLLRRNA